MKNLLKKFTKKDKSGSFTEFDVILCLYVITIKTNSSLGEILHRQIDYLSKEYDPDFVCSYEYKNEASPAKRFTKNATRIIDSIVNEIITALYLWMLDFETIKKYDHDIMQIANNTKDSDDEKQGTDNPPLLNANKIYSAIYQMPSKLDYFLNNPKKTEKQKQTSKNIQDTFIKLINLMPTDAVPFAPSIITIHFNCLEPTSLSRAKIDKATLDYRNMIRCIKQTSTPKKMRKTKLLPGPEDSSFLKMLLLPRDDHKTYDATKRNLIESSFIEYEWQKYCLEADKYNPPSKAVKAPSKKTYFGFSRKEQLDIIKILKKTNFLLHIRILKCS